MASSMSAGKAEQWQMGGRSGQEVAWAGWIEQGRQGRAVVDGREERAIWGRLSGAELGKWLSSVVLECFFSHLESNSYCRQFSYLFPSSTFYMSARRPISIRAGVS